MKKIFIILLFINSFLSSKIIIKNEVNIENIKEEIFVIAENLQLNGKFGNEFIGISKNIEGNFEIDGDFISLSLNQNLAGKIKNDFYSISMKNYFTGITSGSFSIISNIVKIENTEIKGNLRILANKIEVKDVNIMGNCFIFGQKIKLSGTLNDIILNGKEIEIEEGTKIRGNLIYYSPNKISLENVDIKGKVDWKKPYSEKLKEKTIFLKRIKFFYSFFSLVFPYLLLLFFTPNLLISTTITSGKYFLKSLFLGFLFLIFFSFFILFLFITIIGLPTGLILISIFLSSLYISRGFIFVYIGRVIFFKLKDSKSTWFLAIFTGILIFNLLTLNPTLKIICNLLGVFSGFGALISDRVKLFKKLKEEKLI